MGHDFYGADRLRIAKLDPAVKKIKLQLAKWLNPTLTNRKGSSDGL
jgi:hypothetical protein